MFKLSPRRTLPYQQYALVAQLNRVASFYLVGWGFESLRAHHIINRDQKMTTQTLKELEKLYTQDELIDLINVRRAEKEAEAEAEAEAARASQYKQARHINLKIWKKHNLVARKNN